MVDEVDPGLHRRPERVHALPHRLAVRGVRGAGVRGAQRQAVEARHLAGHLRGAHVFGRAEGGRAGLHVDVGGEGADHAGRRPGGSPAGARSPPAPRRSTATTAPAIVTGAMAPASVKGVTITGWPRRAKRIAPSSIGQSCLSGEEELMLVKRRGWLSNSSCAEAAGDARHLDHVLDPLGAEAVGVHDLVGQRQLLVEAVEVADARRGCRPARPGSRRRRGCS